MMILKKKEIIAASLVVLIGMAGYLNWSYQDTMRVQDNESYVETGKMLGEAEMVSSNNEVTEAEPENQEAAAEDAVAEENTEESTEGSAESGTMAETKYFEDAKMNRENARAAAMEALKATSADESLDEETRKLAGEKLVGCAENIELESRVESVAGAKGFNEICAYINDGSVTLTVKSEGLSPEDVEKLTEVAISTAEVSADKVKIIEVK